MPNLHRSTEAQRREKTVYKRQHRDTKINKKSGWEKADIMMSNGGEKHRVRRLQLQNGHSASPGHYQFRYPLLCLVSWLPSNYSWYRRSEVGHVFKCSFSSGLLPNFQDASPVQTRINGSI